MREFGRFVKALRKAKGLTIKDVAGKIGAHKGYISCIENSKVNPPAIRKVRAMAKALGADKVQLLLLAYIEKAPPEIEHLLSEAVRLYLHSGHPRSKLGAVPGQTA